MKVALIDVNCKHSSTGKIVYDLYTELNNNGHEASVYYGRGPKIKERNIFKFGIDLETYFHALMTRITGLTGVYSPFSTWRLIRRLKKFKPDIVHIHELHAYFINLKPIMNFLKKAPLKVIWTFHCEFMFTGKCAYTYSCNKWETECNNCPQVKKYPKSWIFDFSNPMFRKKRELFAGFNNLTIVTPSKWLANRVSRSFLRGMQILVINNGIDQNIFKPSKFDDLNLQNKIADKKVILSVAPNILEDRKGGKKVLSIADKLINENIIFILIGVPKNYLNERENVIALERTSNQIELAKYYSLADKFLILSDMENYPTTCLEALSCGTEIIGYDNGGTSETASLGGGKFIKSDDEIRLIEEILVESKENLDIKSLYTYIHSKERMNEEYLKLYKQKLDDKPNEDNGKYHL